MGQKGAALSISRLLKYFQKYRASGRSSGLFEELPESDRALMTRLAELDAQEQPIVACFCDQDRWVLLTSKRLVRKEGPELQSTASTDIVSVTPPPHHLFEAGTKRAMSKLLIGTADGATFDLHLEPGPPYFAFWNLLRLVAR